MIPYFEENTTRLYHEGQLTEALQANNGSSL
jgi:hypothetical protein